MIFRYFIILILWSLGNPLQAQRYHGLVAPSDYEGFKGDTLKILTWNVEHYVDEYDNPYINAGRENEASEEGVKARMESLSRVLKEINADVVVLQEFESLALLRRIAQDYLPELGYRFFTHAPSPDWYMNVVIMSRVPMGTTYGYGSATTPVPGILNEEGQISTQNHINTRMLSVEFQIQDRYAFILHGMHLKAGRGERNEAMRQGQIEYLLGQGERFQKEKRKTKQIWLGDLNCTPESKEFQQILAGRKKLRFVDPLAGSQTLSHPADKPERRIDHILLNPQMQKDMLPNSVKSIVLESGTAMREISDHLPLVASFLLPK